MRVEAYRVREKPKRFSLSDPELTSCSQKGCKSREIVSRLGEIKRSRKDEGGKADGPGLATERWTTRPGRGSH